MNLLSKGEDLLAVGENREVDVLAEEVVDWHVDLLLAELLHEQAGPKLDFVLEELGNVLAFLIQLVEDLRVLLLAGGFLSLLAVELLREFLLLGSQLHVCHNLLLVILTR